MIESSDNSWLLGTVSTLLLSLGGVVAYLYRLVVGGVDDLEERVRDLEQELVRESKVRQLIEDAITPVKETQGEIKADVKELIRLTLENRTYRRRSTDGEMD